MGGEKVLDEFNGINKQSEFGVYADEMNKISDEFRIETQSASDNPKNNKAIKRKKLLLRQALAITMVTVGVVATQNIQSENIQSENMYNSEINSILSKTIEYAKNDDCKSLYELYIKQNAYEFVEKYGEDIYAYNQSKRNWVMMESVGDKLKSYDLFFINNSTNSTFFIADFSGEEVNGSIDVIVIDDDMVELKKGTMEEGKLVGEIEQHRFSSWLEDGCSRTDEGVTKSQVGGRGIEGKTQIYYSWLVDGDFKEVNCNIYLDHNGNVDVEKSKQLGTTVTFDEDGVLFENKGDNIYSLIDKGRTYVDLCYNFFYDNDDIERLAKAFLSEIDTEE